jgi:hypothetical protein
MDDEHFDSVGTNIANVIILYSVIVLLALLAFNLY